MLNVLNVKKSYGDHLVLRDVSFEVRPGEVVGIVGKNGTGKTTLMKLMMGIYTIDDGNVIIDGKKMKQLRHGPKSVYFIQDDLTFPASQTIGQRFEAECVYYPHADRQVFVDWMNQIGLEASMPIARLSKGQQKSVHLGIALAMQAKYLLLDEFFDGVDVAILEMMIKRLKEETKKGLALVISSHVVGELSIFCDKMIVIENGKSRINEMTRYDEEEVYVQFTIDDKHEALMDSGLLASGYLHLGQVYYAKISGDLTAFNVELEKAFTVKSFRKISLDDMKQMHNFFKEVFRYDT